MYVKEERQRIGPTRKLDAPKWLKQLNLNLEFTFYFLICLCLLLFLVYRKIAPRPPPPRYYQPYNGFKQKVKIKHTDR